MLASGETVEVVAKALKRHHVKALIVDPVRSLLQTIDNLSEDL